MFDVLISTILMTVKLESERICLGTFIRDALQPNFDVKLHLLNARMHE